MLPSRTSCTYIVLWICIQISTEAKRLNHYITNYETLDYDLDHLDMQHQRARRSIENPNIHLKFLAHGRKFHLRLRRDTSLFNADFKMESDGHINDFDTSYIYSGKIHDEANSEVFGSIIGKVFAGRITSPKNGIFHVERANKYFKGKEAFHSIIYHDNHVDMDPQYIKDKKAADKQKHSQGPSTCGHADDRVRTWMSQVANSAVDQAQDIVSRNVQNVHSGTREHNIYSKEANLRRTKRATNLANSGDKKNTCNLYLQSDPELWAHIYQQSKNNAAIAKEEITALFASHVKAISSIYFNTDFSGYTGINFRIDRIKVNTTAGCNYNTNTHAHPFCQKYVDVSNFLNMNSLYNHTKYCLAYVFTYRDFVGGTLGLAWVGSPGRSSGGICEKYKPFTEVLSSGARRTVYKSLNTGIITLINYGQPVPPRVSTLTFAHEVGHNFGSNHDPPTTQCTPGKSQGNYIMYSSATSGEQENNKMFSPCSKKNISLVIEAVINSRDGKRMCLIDSKEAVCGNGIKEEKEECDCGFIGECTDKCCWGYDPGNPGNANNCKLKSNIPNYCSPSQGPCCDESCKPILNSTNTQCHPKGDCQMSSFCDGLGPQCPTPDFKSNGTACNDNTQICKAGECRGSICEKVGTGWNECFKTADANADAEKRKSLCFVSCTNDNKTCWSSYQVDASGFPAAFKTLLTTTLDSPKGIELAAGAPCDNYKGYCDVFQKCRGVDADGPLARLKNLLFNVKTLNAIKDFVTTYWWGVILMGIGLIVLMALFIKCCAVHTPSSNPNKPPPQRISDTLRRRKSNQSRGPPPPYSSAPGGSSGGPPHGRGNRQQAKGQSSGQSRGESSGQRSGGQGQRKGQGRNQMEMKGTRR